MNMPDLINGGFELAGALFTWRNFLRLRRDRRVAGGVALVAGNVAWVGLALRLQRTDS